MLTLLRVRRARAFDAGRSSTALPARPTERAPGSLHFPSATLAPVPFFCGHPAASAYRAMRCGKRQTRLDESAMLPEQQTTNLGGRSSNLFGRAKYLAQIWIGRRTDWGNARGNNGPPRIPDKQLPRTTTLPLGSQQNASPFCDHLRCRVCARRIRNSPAGAHNRLVAGSSPPSPTTQSCANPEFPVFAEHPRFSAVWAGAMDRSRSLRETKTVRKRIGSLRL